jgi:hypothetical protein
MSYEFVRVGGRVFEPGSPALAESSSVFIEELPATCCKLSWLWIFCFVLLSVIIVGFN